LEAEVLAVLWAADQALSPEEVRGRLGRDLAYTTILTILVRLHEKGAVQRESRGRGHAYAPLLDEADLAAQRMHALLAQEADRAAVLSRFVAGLEPDVQSAVRRLLAGQGDGQ
jgi:predicted transcriptional regulator